MNRDKLNTYEIQILRECAGELPASPWGAWVGACLEFLQGGGFVTRGGEIAEKGRQALIIVKEAQ